MNLNFDVRWVDVAPYLQAGQVPIAVIERPPVHNEPKAWAGNTEIARVGRYWVPQQPVLESKQQWVFTDSGQYVRVPIYAYRTLSRALAAIWGLGIQVGMAALDSFRPNKENVVSVVLLLGHDCTDLVNDDAFRCYMGVAIKTEVNNA